MGLRRTGGIRPGPSALLRVMNKPNDVSNEAQEKREDRKITEDARQRSRSKWGGGVINLPVVIPRLFIPRSDRSLILS